MPVRRSLLTCLLSLLVAVLLAVPALAGPPGKWSRVTGVGGVEAANTDEIGLERAAGNGILHVAWTRENGTVGEVLHTAISADGTKGTAPDFIFSSSDGLNNTVDLVAGPGGGLRVLFSGLYSSNPSLDGVLSTATSTATGTAWATPEPFSNNSPGSRSPVYAAAGISGAVGNDGTVFGSWGDSAPGAGGYHIGVNPSGPDIHFSDACCSYDPGIGVDSQSGVVMIARRDETTPIGKVLITRIGGATKTAPKSGASSSGRTSISGRIGAGGVYVAYGKGTNQFLGQPAWWRVGAPKFRFFKSRTGAQYVGLAPAPNGRLWIYWERDERIEAVRTDKQGVNVGSIRSIPLPKGADTVYALNAEGSRGALELLALIDAPGGLGYFHQRIKPGLKLTADPKKVKRGSKIVFTVSDGDPVAGAKVVVKLAGKVFTDTSNAAGKATIHVPANAPIGKRKARASKAGYAKGRRTISIIK